MPPTGPGRNGKSSTSTSRTSTDASGAGAVRRDLLPGEGRLDLQGFLDGLAERGYTGGLTVEATAVGDDGVLDPARLSQMAAAVTQLAS